MDSENNIDIIVKECAILIAKNVISLNQLQKKILQEVKILVKDLEPQYVLYNRYFGTFGFNDEFIKYCKTNNFTFEDFPRTGKIFNYLEDFGKLKAKQNNIELYNYLDYGLRYAQLSSSNLTYSKFFSYIDWYIENNNGQETIKFR
jgi:hypothetical protein